MWYLIPVFLLLAGLALAVALAVSWVFVGARLEVDGPAVVIDVRTWTWGGLPHFVMARLGTGRPADPATGQATAGGGGRATGSRLFRPLLWPTLWPLFWPVPRSLIGVARAAPGDRLERAAEAGWGTILRETGALGPRIAGVRLAAGYLARRARLVELTVHARIGTRDAARTGVLVGAAWALAGHVTTFLRARAAGHLPRDQARIAFAFAPAFDRPTLLLDACCIVKMRGGHIMVATAKAVLAAIKLARQTRPRAASRCGRPGEAWQRGKAPSKSIPSRA